MFVGDMIIHLQILNALTKDTKMLSNKVVLADPKLIYQVKLTFLCNHENMGSIMKKAYTLSDKQNNYILKCPAVLLFY